MDAETLFYLPPKRKAELREHYAFQVQEFVEAARYTNRAAIAHVRARGHNDYTDFLFRLVIQYMETARAKRLHLRKYQ